MQPMLAKTEDEEWLLEIESDPNWAVARKWDGIRLMLFLNNSGNRLLTRSGTNVIKNTPQFQRIISGLNGTVLDTEGISPSHYLGDVQSIIHHTTDAKLVLFDCLKFRGEEIIDLPLSERRKYLRKSYQILRGDKWPVIFERLAKRNKKAFYEKEIKESGEGVMVKSLKAPYTPGARTGVWVKVKKRDTFEFVIMGFTKGTGKYTGQVGAIRYGAYHNGKLVELGRSSGMTDAERQSMTNSPGRYIGKVAEFEAQELTRAGAMRHPSFIRMRPDLNPREILLDFI